MTGMDYQCTACGRIYRGRSASTGYPRVYPILGSHGVCPRCAADARGAAAKAAAAGQKASHAAWNFLLGRNQQHYPGGKRAGHLRRASQPSPFRSRSEPIKRARKAHKRKAKR